MAPLQSMELKRLEDLAAAVESHRRQGHAEAALPVDDLADWLAGWRADRLRAYDAQEEARRWRARAKRGEAKAAAHGGRREVRGGGR